MSDIVTLSTEFRISIPKHIRRAQQWEAGQKFAFMPKGTGVLLIPVPKAEELVGIAKGANSGKYRDRR